MDIVVISDLFFVSVENTRYVYFKISFENFATGQQGFLASCKDSRTHVKAGVWEVSSWMSER